MTKLTLRYFAVIAAVIGLGIALPLWCLGESVRYFAAWLGKTCHEVLYRECDKRAAATGATQEGGRDG